MIVLPSIDVEWAIICDDVRKEDNGKLILIGVYANDIVLRRFPGTLSLRLVTRLHPKTNEVPLGFKITFDDQDAFYISGKLLSPNLDSETSPTPPWVIELKQAGVLQVFVSDEEFESEAPGNMKWTPLLSLPVTLLNEA